MWIEGIGEVVIMKKTSAMRRPMVTTYLVYKKAIRSSWCRNAPQISMGGFMWSGVA